jgi:hypothetical protein
MNTPIPLLCWLAAALLVLAWRRCRLHGLLLVAAGCVLAGTGIDALLRGPWDVDLRLVEGAVMAAALLFAWGAWVVFDASTHPAGRAVVNPQKRSGASALAHVGLRLLVCAFAAAFAMMFGMIAPGLLDAVPVLQSYAVAAAIVLVVWALWPATRYRGRGHRTEAASG